MMAINGDIAVQNRIMTKADQLANDLRGKLNCDAVFISLINETQQFAFGISSGNLQEEVLREFKRDDTVCGVVASLNQPISARDARQREELAQTPYVVAGGVVGYMGIPIRDERQRCIGALCAITDQPRAWSETDELSAQLTCQTVEHLLHIESQKLQLENCHQTLDDYDTILSIIALNTDELASVHGPDGEMLFATEKLLEEVSPCFQEIKSRWQDHFQALPDETEGVVPPEPAPHPTSRVVKGRAPGAGWWSGRLKGKSGNLTFIGWEPGQA